MALEVDGRHTPLVLTGVQFPSRGEMNEGTGAIRLDLAAQTALGEAGEHQLCFRNDHMPDLGVSLANALVPAADTIKITKQQRDQLQHELRVNFGVLLSSDTRAWPRRTARFLLALCLALLLSQWKRLRSFFGAPSQPLSRMNIKSEWKGRFLIFRNLIVGMIFLSIFNWLQR
jgi:hypothetical protein